MEIMPIDLADFDLVEVKTTNECKPTPHCKNHGAMNKITTDGFWRCISVTGYSGVMNATGGKGMVHRETICRAGCQTISPTTEQ